MRCSTRSKRRSTGWSQRAASCRRCSSSARRCAAHGRLYNCAFVIHRGAAARRGAEGVSAELSRILRATAFHLGRGGARPARSRSPAMRRRSASICCSRPTGPAASPFMSRSARICGCRSRRAPPARRPAPKSCSTCRPATSSSARRRCGACLCASQSARCIAAYAYSAAGAGESTTDLAWDGQAGIFEIGDGLAETERFSAQRRDGHRRCRSRPHPSGAHAHQHLRRLRARDRWRQRRRSARVDVRFRRARRPAGAAPRRRALPVCAGRSGDAARQLLRGLQHPGAGAGAAAHGDRARKAGDRRLGRARTRPRR